MMPPNVTPSSSNIYYEFKLDVTDLGPGDEIIQIRAGEFKVRNGQTEEEIQLPREGFPLYDEGKALGVLDYHNLNGDSTHLLRIPDQDGDGQPELMSLNMGKVVHTPLYAFHKTEDVPVVVVQHSDQDLGLCTVITPQYAPDDHYFVHQEAVETSFVPEYSLRWDLDESQPGLEQLTITGRTLAPEARNVQITDANGQPLSQEQVGVKISRNYRSTDYLQFPNSYDGLEIRFGRGMDRSRPIYVSQDPTRAEQVNPPVAYSGLTETWLGTFNWSWNKSNITLMDIRIQGEAPVMGESPSPIFTPYLPAE